jgi:arylsulfatase A-like enzyme
MNTQSPNIIYILGDDHRADYLGCAGHPVLKTPHLDELASEGVRFTRAFCTSPACTPSRASHYTGQWERKHGINFNSGSSMAPKAWEKSFPMLLKEQGYFTGWIGKNHVPAGGGKTGYDSGYFDSVFDYWYGNHGHCGFYPKEHESGEPYHNATNNTQVEIFAEAVNDFLKPNPQFRTLLKSKLSERPANEPFCLCVTFNLPHGTSTGTMQLRPEDDELYRTAYRDCQHLMPLPKTYVQYEKAFENPRLPRSVYNGHYIPQYDYVKHPCTLRERQVRTCQTIAGIDRFVGNLRRQLSELHLSDNTIIIFSTDHGEHHGEHGLGGKCFLYEEDIHIPLIIYDPRISGDSHLSDELVVVPDLAPTVLDLCGLEAPETMQGKSLKPLLNGQKTAWRQDFFAEQLMDIQNYPRSESVRNDNWKYIRYFARKEDPAQANKAFRGTLDDYNECLTSTSKDELPIYEELFDLQNDPNETTNLASKSAHCNQLLYFRNRLVELAREAKGDDSPPITIPFAAFSS